MTEQKNNYRRLFKNHSGVIGYWDAWQEGARVVMQHAKTLDGKPVTRVYDAQGKNAGRANETTPEQQAALEIESRTKKQLDKGYVTQIEDAGAPSTNTLGLKKPMLATPFDKVKPESIDWTSAYAQPKFDGHRALFKDGVLYSRQGKVIDMPHILDAIKAVGLEDEHLDGELYLHGRSLQEIGSLVKRAQEDTAKLVYHVYDNVQSDAGWLDRYQDTCNTLFGHNHPSIQHVISIPVPNAERLMALHTQFLADGYEGTMLRLGHEGYQDGKRSKQLLKLKDFKDEEFLVVGVNRGTPYITIDGIHEVPVWVCQSGGHTFCVTAQGNREEKNAQWLERDSYIGRQLTVKYHYMSADGIPQLPVALRWREDI